jgi:hypothetical protein
MPVGVVMLLLPIEHRPHDNATDECIAVSEQPVSAIALNKLTGGFASKDCGIEIPTLSVGPLGSIGNLMQGIRIKPQINTAIGNFLHREVP